jgi:hypothetical protein
MYAAPYNDISAAGLKQGPNYPLLFFSKRRRQYGGFVTLPEKNCRFRNDGVASATGLPGYKKRKKPFRPYSSIIMFLSNKNWTLKAYINKM